MTEWTDGDLAAIGGAEELQVATIRADGSQRAWLPIWVVRVGDGLFVRSANGRDGSWFRHALRTGRGRIRAGGVESDVTFAEAAPALGSALDDAYRAKYARYTRNFLPPMLTPQARAAVLELVPR